MGTSGLFGSSKQLRPGSGDAAPDGMVDNLVFLALYVTEENIGRFDHRTRNSFRSGDSVGACEQGTAEVSS
jgi:hypothetical protein